MSGWPAGHQPRKRGSVVDVGGAVGLGRLEHRAEHPVRARQRARARRSARRSCPTTRKRLKPPSPSGIAERGVARAGQLARAVDEPLQDLLDRRAATATASTASLTARSAGSNPAALIASGGGARRVRGLRVADELADARLLARAQQLDRVGRSVDDLLEERPCGPGRWAACPSPSRGPR